MTLEFERFLTLFDRSVHSTNDWIARVPRDKFEWIPVDNSNLAYGDRVPRPTIKSLFIHLAVAEHRRLRDIKECPENGMLPIPHDPELTARLGSGDIVANAMAIHKGNMELLRGFTEDILEKHVHFVDQRWTVMGLLWAIYAHRTFHLGNIDIYLRQCNVAAPEFHPVTTAAAMA